MKRFFFRHFFSTTARAAIGKSFAVFSMASAFCALLLCLPLTARTELAPAPFSSRLEIVRAPEDIGPIQADTFLGAFWMTPVPGWYAYGHEPGPAGMPTALQAMLSPGDDYLQVFYPRGTIQEDSLEPGIMVETYAEPTPLFIALPGNIDPGQSLHVHLRMLLCSDRSCWPVDMQKVFSAREIQDLLRERTGDESSSASWAKRLATAQAGATRTPLVQIGRAHV